MPHGCVHSPGFPNLRINSFRKTGYDPIHISIQLLRQAVFKRVISEPRSLSRTQQHREGETRIVMLMNLNHPYNSSGVTDQHPMEPTQPSDDIIANLNVESHWRSSCQVSMLAITWADPCLASTPIGLNAVLLGALHQPWTGLQARVSYFIISDNDRYLKVDTIARPKVFQNTQYWWIFICSHMRTRTHTHTTCTAQKTTTTRIWQRTIHRMTTTPRTVKNNGNVKMVCPKKHELVNSLHGKGLKSKHRFHSVYYNYGQRKV